MKEILRIVYHESFQWTRNVVRMLLLGTVVILTLAVAGVRFGSEYSYLLKAEAQYPETEMSVAQRNSLLAEYAHELVYSQEYLRQAEFVNAPSAVLAKYREECARYAFFLETGTVESDYLDAGTLTQLTYGYHGSAFPFIVLDTFFYPLLFFALMLGVSAFGMEYRSGTIKNVVTAPVRRRNIIYGKALFLAMVMTMSLFVLMVLSLGIGALFGFGDAEVLVFSGTICRGVPVLVLFFVRIVLAWVAMLFVAAVAAVFGIVLRSPIAAIIAPVGVYLLSIGVFNVVVGFRQYTYYEPNLAAIAMFYPIVGLQYHMEAWSGIFWFLIGYHGLLIAIGLLAAITLFKRQNI